MIQPENWHHLKKSPAFAPQMPFKAFRVEADDVYHYKAGRQEFIAVHNRDPYGDLTEAAFANSSSFNLLQAIHKAKDYTAYEVPTNTLSLEAINQGTGRHQTELLEPLYNQIGSVVRRIAEVTEGKAPLLETDDIAVNRNTAEILLLPPLPFGEESHDIRDYARAFTSSMRTNFESLWLPHKTNELIEEFMMGMNYDNAK